MVLAISVFRQNAVSGNDAGRITDTQEDTKVISGDLAATMALEQINLTLVCKNQGPKP